MAQVCCLVEIVRRNTAQADGIIDAIVTTRHGILTSIAVVSSRMQVVAASIAHGTGIYISAGLTIGQNLLAQPAGSAILQHPRLVQTFSALRLVYALQTVVNK